MTRGTKDMSFFSHRARIDQKNNGVKDRTITRLILASALLLTGCPPAEPVSS